MKDLLRVMDATDHSSDMEAEGNSCMLAGLLVRLVVVVVVVVLSNLFCKQTTEEGFHFSLCDVSLGQERRAFITNRIFALCASRPGCSLSY